MHINAIFDGSLDSTFETKIDNNNLIYGPNIDCGCLLEPPQWGGSNEHPHSMFVQKK